MVYYEGGTVAWSTNLVDHDVAQISLPLPQEIKRRTKIKDIKKHGDQDVKTGTSDE
jgi:hypothetical protein